MSFDLPDPYEEGWPEVLHAALADAQATMRLTLLSLTSLCAALGQRDPVTAALDIMRTHTDTPVSPKSLRAIIEEVDTYGY